MTKRIVILIIGIFLFASCASRKKDTVKLTATKTDQARLKYLKVKKYKNKRFRVTRKTLVDCLNGLERACLLAGNTKTAKNDLKRAFRFYEMACNLNDGEGCYNAGAIDWRRKKYHSAKVFYKKACYLKNGQGCFEMGLLSKKEKDELNRNNYLMLSCEFKYALGCKFYGDIYFNKNEIKRAYRYYKLACKLKEGIGCYNAGILVRDVDGLKDAVPLFKEACQLKNYHGCYYTMLLAIKDNKEQMAFEYLEKSLKNGMKDWDRLEFSPELNSLRKKTKYRELLDKYLLKTI